MKWLFIYRRDLEVCYVFFCSFVFCVFFLVFCVFVFFFCVFFFFHFFISFKYDFHVDIERMIVKTREKCKELSASMA